MFIKKNGFSIILLRFACGKIDKLLFTDRNTQKEIFVDVMPKKL